MRKQSSSSKPFTRRDFLRTSAFAAGAVWMPLVVPSRLFGADAPSNRIRVGHIGCGRIATVHDMPGVLSSGMADYVAVCDLDSKRAAAAKKFLDNAQKNYAVPPWIE